MSRRAVAAALLLIVTATRAAKGQSAPRVPSVGGRAEVFAGGELENYLRYLQTLGEVAPYPWGLRAFSPSELDALMPRDTAHPWFARYDLARRERSGASLEWIAPTASARLNSTFPFGFNDGPIWAGRGVTLAAQGGVAVRWGVLSVTVAPMAFLAQNATFPLQANGDSGRLAFANGLHANVVDLPQRFGNTPYARLDPGQSTARLDWGPLAVGVSTANQYWGPATEFPVILGNNAAGIPQVFAGTAHPADLWLLRLHFRFIWGRLGQSAYGGETASGGVRFATGLDVSLTSRWVPGLEIGATRFSHTPWPSGGPRLKDLLRMLQSQAAANVGVGSGNDNELASAYFRWVLPRSGFEVYGEYGRDDYNMDLRDFFEEPDHMGGYTLGFRKVMRRGGNRLLAVRAELQNLQYSQLALGRAWQPFYTHSTTVKQGHTQLGQALGSEAGLGGAGSVVAVESYAPTGRWTVSWTRILREQLADSLQTQPGLKGLDVQHELAVERLVFLGRYDLLMRVGAIYELNRYFQGDAFDLNLMVGVRAGLP